MSPTSYQTAPPRSSIINNAFDIVKLPAATPFASSRVPAALLPKQAGDSYLKLPDGLSHPTADSGHRRKRRFCKRNVKRGKQGEHRLWPEKVSMRKYLPANEAA